MPHKADIHDRSMRLNIDVTETLASGRWTGIERVVRRVIAELTTSVDPEISIRLVAAVGGRFHVLNDRGLLRLNQHASGGKPTPPGRASRMLGTLLQFSAPLYTAAQSFYKRRQVEPQLTPLLARDPADFGACDVVFLLDSYWAGLSTVQAAIKARRQGSKVISALYDVIPITHPQYMTPLLGMIFPIYLRQALQISDGALAISRHSADELRRYLGTELPDLPISWFHLGHDSGAAAVPVLDHVTDQTRRYLIVGTIEPRKGHDIVLDAFDALWGNGSESHLTIIGKMGWASPAMQLRLDDHPELNRRLHVVHDASDSDLAAAMARADAVIMASSVEGFGLPIVEALASDTPVIASDIPVFREIGGDTLLYFKSGNSEDLAKTISAFEDDMPHWKAKARAFSWPSWQASTQTAVSFIKTIMRGDQAKPR